MKKEILRIIDANINRITEGLRVVEEILRFVYKQDKLYKLLRSIRHKVVKIFSKFYPESLFHRNSKIDPGKNAKERKYSNVKEIIVSNLHRITESLRVLEELAKLVLPKSVKDIKILRYKVYDIEKYIMQKIIK